MLGFRCSYDQHQRTESSSIFKNCMDTISYHCLFRFYIMVMETLVMRQYHFRLKAGNFANSYYITDSNRDRAFDSAQWEFFKDCEDKGFVAMSCLLEFEEVNEI